jgi:amino acid transporter
MLSFGKRPRELAWYHAGPMLFGDWGTSRLYVLGMAFVAAGHGSLFYVSWMAVLLLAVGWAYSVICRLHPEGGGVYTAAREQSPLLGVIGGLLLFADYVVTASLSAVDAFRYLGASKEEAPWWAVGAIGTLGVMHYYGPKKAGVLALWIAGAAFIGYLIIAAFAVPHLRETVVTIPVDTPFGHWRQLAHIVLALSGVEAVANMTGIMVPPVQRTSRLAIWPVAFEVVVLNLLFALAMNALPDGVANGHNDDMLHVLAEQYVGPSFARVSSAAFALLLLSASSTAMTDMLGIQFAMARDAELPRPLARLNRFGVPQRALVIATLAPITVLLLERDFDALAALYAIGVVGAVCLNCYATARTSARGMRAWERVALLGIAAVMALLWVTLAYEKRNALIFATTVLSVGLLARLAFRKYREIARPVERVPFPSDAPRILVATRGDSWVVDRGYDRAAEIGAAVIVALIREASFVPFAIRLTDPLDPAIDPEAAALFDYARRKAQERDIPVRTLYEMSTSPMVVIADHAVTLGASEVHVGGSRRTGFEKVLRGSPLDELRNLLPEDVKMLVHRPRQGDGE